MSKDIAMAKHSVIVSNPKYRKSTRPVSERGHRVSRTSGQDDYAKRNKGKGYTELPPGPENFIVRTPYPLPPSKEDEAST